MEETAQPQETQVSQAGPKTPKILLFAVIILGLLVAAEVGYLVYLNWLKPKEEVAKVVPQPTSATPPPDFSITMPFGKEYFLSAVVSEDTFDSPETAIFARLTPGSAVYAGLAGSISLGGGFPVKFPHAFLELHAEDGYTLIYYFAGDTFVADGEEVQAGQLLGEIKKGELNFLEDKTVNFVLRLLRDGERQSMRISMLRPPSAEKQKQ